MDQLIRDPEKREKFFKVFLYTRDILKRMGYFIKYATLFIFSLTSLLFFFLFIYHIGFDHSEETIRKITSAFRIILLILFITRVISGLLSLEKRYLSLSIRVGIVIFSFIVLLSNSGLIAQSAHFWGRFYGNGMVILACFTLSIIEIARLFDLISSFNIPPALIFSASFFIIIIIGSGMLMLPNSRIIPMKYIDALFTSVSAVCVTGLSVVNIAGSFTLMGKIIILCLIQIGGLGMMTFTGFFSFIFTSRATLQERMLLQDLFSAESLGNLFQILVQIVIVTLIIEGAGALIIYLSLDTDVTNKVMLSIFHSVSAFCNAGFSTLKDGLMSPGFNNNYLLLSVIMVLIVIGGIGFPVMIKFFAVVRSRMIIIADSLKRRSSYSRKEVFDAGSKIVLRATIGLIIAGALILFVVERNTSMKGMLPSRQLFLSLFNSVTTRTAGFNMSDLTLLGYPAVYLMILLMWIGASPGSTGGGIKTTTFFIAVRSAWSNIRGKKSLEIGTREINPGTINRVLAIIILSILVIGTGFFLLLITEPQKDPSHLLFESVSAFSTVGLSLADTSTFHEASKWIIICLMFIGRVGPLTLLTGLFFSGRKTYHKYPVGDIAIN